jgi:glycerol kinase
MRERSGVPFDVLRVDGGASANGWLMQFQADLLGVPVERPNLVESTALGAAGLAGTAAGIWPDAEAFLATRRFDRFVPGAGSQNARAAVVGWDRAVRAALTWARDGAS